MNSLFDSRPSAVPKRLSRYDEVPPRFFSAERPETFNAPLENDYPRVRSRAKFKTFTGEIRDTSRNTREIGVEFSLAGKHVNRIVFLRHRIGLILEFITLNLSFPRYLFQAFLGAFPTGGSVIRCNGN